MNKRLVLIIYRLLVAAVVLAAVVTQLTHSAGRIIGFSYVNFFSFFTIESNLFGAAMFIALAALLLQKRTSALADNLRGAATLFMVITGIIYSLLLTGVDVQASLPWCNAVLHYIFPVVILADWLIFPPAKKIRYGSSAYWLLYPVGYGLYSLVRGPLAQHWYPYPFLNTYQYGYVRVAMNMVVIGLGMGLLVMAFTWLTTLRQAAGPKRRK